jgi:hypothetical protein
MEKERHKKRLGLGTENLTVYYHNHPDKVFKFAIQLYIFKKYFLDKNGNNSTKDRVEDNLQTIRQHVDEQFLPRTDVKSAINIWYIQQEKLPVANFVSSKNPDNNPQLISQIKEVIKQVGSMHEKTGYYIDWFGFNQLDEVFKLLTVPDYWSIPNLVIDNNKQLKIFDLGLYRDNNAPKEKKHSTLSPPIDSALCKLHLFLIKKILKKIEK